MELEFTFHPMKKTKNSSLRYAPKDFVWKYELQLTTEDRNIEVCIHGYFKLHSGIKTQLSLSGKYAKGNVKYIRFTVFEPCSPQRRAWFVPIKGLAFGMPRCLFPRNSGELGF